MIASLYQSASVRAGALAEATAEAIADAAAGTVVDPTRPSYKK
jgi:hypothetical protein